MKKSTEETSVAAFFVGCSIFVTGATGFMGKVLIEKLLRSCPGVEKIFLLIRPKKEIGVGDRLKKLLSNKLFDKLRAEQPSSFDKLVPVAGNTAVAGLGLLPEDRQMLIDKISVIFHIAASVRFDDSLKDAIFINTRSTRDVCILASSMKNLKVLLHVSSTYSQIDKSVVDEILYPTDIDWKHAIRIAETVDEYTLKILTAKYIGTMPNTYVFTKKLAEQVISDYSESLPCVLLRPSIVISTVDDPIKGWIDNFNGPIGMLVGGGKGILRVVYADPIVNCDYVPVDLTIKLMIISAWKRGFKTFYEDKTVHVYNCSSNRVKKLNVLQMIQMGFDVLREIPLEGLIWSPYTLVTKNRWLFYILIMLLHIFPAICIDSILKLFGAKPILLKLQRKVYVSNSALSHFVMNEWFFINTRALETLNMLSDENEDFKVDYANLDIREFFKNGLIGSKIYLLNEDMNNLEKHRRHRTRMDWLDTIVKTIFITFILWILYSKNILLNMANVFTQYMSYVI